MKYDNNYVDFTISYRGHKYSMENDRDVDNVEFENVIFVAQPDVKVYRRKGPTMFSYNHDFSKFLDHNIVTLHCKPIKVEITVVDIPIVVNTSLVIDDRDGWKIYMTPLLKGDKK